MRRCDVDAFSYLSVLLSIILGLAITQILQGLRRLMQARSRLRVYALGGDVGAAAARRRCAVVGAMSDQRTVEHWSFVAFGVVVMHMICLYMVAALVLPEAPRRSTCPSTIGATTAGSSRSSC